MTTHDTAKPAERTSPPLLLAGLVRAATTAPDRSALIMADGRRMTYARLLERVTRAAAGFTAHGITRGTRTVVLAPPAPDFLVTVFGLLACGAVPVLVDPGIGVRRVRTALGEVAPAAFVGSPRAHAARRLLRWAPTATRSVVTDGTRPARAATGGEAVSLDWIEQTAPGDGGHAGWTPQADGEEAALLFTSGSTGAPKGVAYDHTHFAAVVAALCATYELEAGEVTVATFPPFALFGPALGQTTVLPDMDFTRPAAADPEHLRTLIATHEADLLFASPALLASLARYGAPLPCVRLVLSAGAPVSGRLADAITALLPPGATIGAPYGMTEALPVCAIAGDELHAAARLHDPPRGVCVGAPVPHTDVAVIRVTDRPLPTVTADDLCADGEVGELVVRGPQVTETYVARPAATARAKTTWDGRPAHRTGDLAWRDPQGRLWFCGRTVHRIRTAAGPLDPLPVEQLVLDHPGVRRAALVGVVRDGTTRPVLVVQPSTATSARLRPWRPGGRRTRAALLEALRARLDAHPHGALVTRVMLRSRFPVDARHNAKIGYEQLARWATARLDGRVAWIGRRAFGGGST